ncbi:hypothetical protein VQH23_00120 [Pararoseomonas sp. SCSIO 73927]|uniref:hypothetical protein n=1 Tax=Pararoseomonas sp. SCSIO 73927 TaxID=3114537 RepID=UPI0030CB2459
MSRPFDDTARITRVLAMPGPRNGAGKLAIGFEAGSRAGTVLVVTGGSGRHSLSFRDHPPAALEPDRGGGAEVLLLPGGKRGADAKIHRPEAGETEALHARRDAVVRRSMRLLALPVHSYWR